MAFSVTEVQYDTLIARVTALENHINDITVAIDRFISNEEMNELNILFQTQVESLDTQVQALEARVTAIEEEPLL